MTAGTTARPRTFWREMRLLVVAVAVWLAAMTVTGVVFGLVYLHHNAELQKQFQNAASFPSIVGAGTGYVVVAAFLLWRLPPTTASSLSQLGV